MRDKCWKDIGWQYKFVHGRIHDPQELEFIKAHGVEVISFDNVLEKLCGAEPGELFGGAGTDIAEIVRYYAEMTTLRARAATVEGKQGKRATT